MLYVGRLKTHDLALVESVLPAPLNSDMQAPWRLAREKIAAIDNLNIASLCVYNRHVEGLVDPLSEGGDARSRFPNTPWMAYCIWVPLEFRIPLAPTKDPSGWPIFIGSAIALLRELNAIQKLSPMELGTIPEHYELMRTDIRKFYKTDIAVPADKVATQCTQWVWRSLFDAATLSIEKDAPLVGAFD